MAKNIMMSNLRRAPAGTKGFFNNYDFQKLSAEGQKEFEADLGRVFKPSTKVLRTTPLLRPFLGIVARFAPLVGTILEVDNIRHLWIQMTEGYIRPHGWTTEYFCGTPEALTGSIYGVFPANCGITRQFDTVASWNAGIDNPTLAGGYYHLGGYSEVQNPDATFPTLVSAMPKAHYSMLAIDYVPGVIPAFSKAYTIPVIFDYDNPAIWGFDPVTMPVNAPAGFPKALPLSVSPQRQPNPYRSSSYDFLAEYTLPGIPTFHPNGFEVGALDRVSPPVVVESIAGTTTITQTMHGFPPRHRLARAGKRVKEKKARIKGYHLITGLIGKGTDVAEIVNAIYDALPKEHKRKGLNPWKYDEYAKLKWLAHNWQYLDVKKAVKNLIDNEFEDRVIGFLGKNSKELAQKYRPHGNIPIGYQAGKAL